MDDIKAGVYRHYKGPLYLVMGLAHDANSDEIMTERDGWTAEAPRHVVLYIGLQLDGAHTGPRLAVRTLDDFFAVVCVDGTGNCPNGGKEVSFRADSCVHCGLPTRQRFTYVGPTWEGE